MSSSGESLKSDSGNLCYDFALQRGSCASLYLSDYIHTEETPMKDNFYNYCLSESAKRDHQRDANRVCRQKIFFVISSPAIFLGCLYIQPVGQCYERCIASNPTADQRICLYFFRTGPKHGALFTGPSRSRLSVPWCSPVIFRVLQIEERTAPTAIAARMIQFENLCLSSFPISKYRRCIYRL